MNSWELQSMVVRPHAPEILHSGDGGRAILLEIPAGESLQDHQVHEHAWAMVLSGEAEVSTESERISSAAGSLVEFAPGERHAVRALSTTRLLLILTPWPGDGHPGAMGLDDKRTVRQRASEHRQNA